MWDRPRQLGESGEYWMRRLRVVWCQIRSSKVVAPACIDWGLIVWPRWTRLSFVLMNTGFMGSHKLSSFDVRWIGWHSTVLHEWHWDSVHATHGLPGEVFTWKTILGYGGPGPARLFDSQCERWPLMIPVWFTCVVLSGYFSCKVTIDSNLCDTLRYGWSLFAVVIP
jgi:hypothetical protein